MKSKTRAWLLAALAAAIIFTAPAMAQDSGSAEPYHSPDGKREVGLEVFATKKIAFSGLLEAEIGWQKIKNTNGTSTSASDIVLATAQLGFETEVTRNVTGTLVLLWEEDATEPIGIDEGMLAWNGANGFGITAGRMYPPFGTFNSHFISDPLTLELGEVQETALQFSIAPSESFEASITFANGGLDKTGANDTISDWVLRADFHGNTSGQGTVDFGVQYINDIADTDSGLFDPDPAANPGLADGTSKTVAGLGVNLDYANGPWMLFLEYVGATRDFDPADLPGATPAAGLQPRTWNFEMGYLISDAHEIAIKYEGSDDFTGFPKSQWGVDSTWTLDEGLFLSLEYLYGTFDQTLNTVAKRHTLTAQLALEF
jgi:hypothetical protein